MTKLNCWQTADKGHERGKTGSSRRTSNGQMGRGRPGGLDMRCDHGQADQCMWCSSRQVLASLPVQPASPACQYGQSYRHPHAPAHSRPPWAIPLRHDDEGEDTDTITTTHKNLQWQAMGNHGCTAARLHGCTGPKAWRWRVAKMGNRWGGLWVDGRLSSSVCRNLVKPSAVQARPTSQPASLPAACCAMLHGRILAAFHKTSSALVVAPATLPPSMANPCNQPCSSACSHVTMQPRQPILPILPRPSEMAEWHGNYNNEQQQQRQRQ